MPDVTEHVPPRKSPDFWRVALRRDRLQVSGSRQAHIDPIVRGGKTFVRPLQFG
jgi:hypothetical protein